VFHLDKILSEHQPCVRKTMCTASSEKRSSKYIK